MHCLSHLLLCAVLLGGIASGQDPVPIGSWRVPIHGAPSGLDAERYGLWAGGPDYKASFHAGFAFYPCLGEAYPHNLPLSWTTESVRVGDEVLVGGAATHELWHSDWRCEYRHPGITEAYDVLAEGVEQTFILHDAPALPGDLVISGRIATELRAQPVWEEHAELVFCDATGNALVTYGKAHAYDARGQSAAVTTRYEGGMIRLRLDGDWLARASFPVTVDPLVSRVSIATWGGPLHGAPADTDIARDDESNQVMVTYRRASSASDMDVYGWLRTDDFSPVAQVFTRLTTSTSDSHPRVAFVSGADRWLIAYQSLSSSGQCSLMFYTHVKGNTGRNTGRLSNLQPSLSNHHYHRPDVGGTAALSAGGHALIVYQEDIAPTYTDTDYSEVHGIWLDVTGSSHSNGFRLSSTVSGSTYDRGWPTVSQVSDGGSSSWVAAWQEYNNNIANDDWDIYMVRIDGSGARTGTSTLGTSHSANHKLRPVVEGRDGRYLASFAVTRNNGKTNMDWGAEIRVQRFDWRENSSNPTRGTIRVLARASSGAFVVNGRNIGHDSNTRSHWVPAWSGVYLSGVNSRVYAARVGYTGRTVEQVTVYSSGAGDGHSPAVTFNGDDSEFQIVWSSNEGALRQQPVFGNRLQYPSAASNSTFGSGCRGSIMALPPYAGSEFFMVFLRSGASNAIAMLLLGLGQGHVPLGNGCVLNLDPLQPIYILHSTTTNSSGNTDCTIALPDGPYFAANVYLQWLQVSLTGQISATRGMVSAIR